MPIGQLDGAVGAGLHASAAAAAVRRFNAGGEWLQLDVAGIHKRDGHGSSSAALSHTIGDIFWPLAGAGQQHAVGNSFNRGQLGVFFEEEAVWPPADAEQVAYLRGVGLRFETGA